MVLVGGCELEIAADPRLNGEKLQMSTSHCKTSNPLSGFNACIFQRTRWLGVDAYLPDILK